MGNLEITQPCEDRPGKENFTPMSKWTRRDFFKNSGLFAAAGLAGNGKKTGKKASPPSPATRSDLPHGPNLYEKIGVKPFINCQGTFTILSGSLSLPEVKQAMEEASRHYVHLDELMEKVGQRLAELTGAEFGIVTAGCAAALTHVTAACVAGADPEKMQRLPDVTGLKNEVIMPMASRNEYDHAIRMVGVKIIEVGNSQEFREAVNKRTAMITLLGDAEDRNGVSLEEMVEVGRQYKIPVLVDAAAERPDVPNYYLKKGVDVVAYSGGKCLRGPQCSGLALGPKDLLWAAWLNSAPHHAFGRSMKVGKEEIMGLLTAVEMWVRHRDHKAEWQQWESWLQTITGQVTQVPGARTEVERPGRSNVAPTLSITWDAAKVKMTGAELKKSLNEGTPRIWVPLGSNGGISIMPYMMQPGEDKIVAQRLREVLSAASAG
jgi:D-glucosaminate-6-phosphate ammonia-lyase